MRTPNPPSEAMAALHPVTAHALQALEAAINRPVGVAKAQGSGAQSAFSLQLAGKWRLFAPQVHPVINSMSHIAMLQARPAQAKGIPLLVTSHLGEALARQCVRQGIQFIDLAGNAYIDVPGQTIVVLGRRADKQALLAARRSHTGGAVGTTVLRIIFLLLSQPEALHWRYREVAAAAGVSLGAVGKALHELEVRGLVSLGTGRAKKRLLDGSSLLDEWIINFPLRLRPKLHGHRFTAEVLPHHADIALPAGQAWWGGEVAAAIAGAGVLHPREKILYVHPDAKDALLQTWIRQYRLRPALTGEIEILDAFWTPAEGGQEERHVPAALIISDLLQSREARDKEAAQWLRKEMTSR